MSETYKATTPPQIYLTVRGGEEAIEFYVKAFGASEDFRQMADDGKRILHATLSLLGGHIMLSDEFPEFDADTKSPLSVGGASVTVHINLESRKTVDEVMKSAETAGARITMPAAEMFWGAYYGRLVDPFGHSWSFAAEHKQAGTGEAS